MTKDEMLAEMRRRPNAHLLAEWIDLRIEDSDSEIAQVLDAYFRALEG
jgi:hypothetical protein